MPCWGFSIKPAIFAEFAYLSMLETTVSEKDVRENQCHVFSVEVHKVVNEMHHTNRTVQHSLGYFRFQIIRCSVHAV